MKKSQNWMFPIASAALTAAVFIALGSARSAEKSFESDRLSTHDAAYGEHVKDNYKVYSLPTPVNVTFAGEEVPLDRFGVREKLDRELLVNTYWHSNTLLLFKRCNRWFPVIEPILARNGVPDDFKYLAVIESGLTNAVSSAGATGFWQFLKATGESYGLEVNDEVDERYHVERSTEAACRYLNEAYRKFGDWALVAASYNMGMGGVNKQIERQKVQEYWDLLLNEETSRYVYRILAVKEILNNGTAYGFVVRESDLYDPYEVRTVAIDSSVTDLADFALAQGANYNVLKSLNPWLRQSYLKNAKKKAYTILLPEDV
jgi:hypothetical protein